MLEALINKKTRKFVVVKKMPCVWSEREHKEFDIRKLDDPELEAKVKGVATLPYKVTTTPALSPTGENVKGHVTLTDSEYKLKVGNVKPTITKDDLDHEVLSAFSS